MLEGNATKEGRYTQTNKKTGREGGREAGRQAGRKQGKEARKKVTYSWTVGRQSLGSYLPHRWKFQSNPCKDNNMNSTLMFAATTLFHLSLLTPCQTTHQPTHLPTYLQSACLSAYLPTNLYTCLLPTKLSYTRPLISHLSLVSRIRARYHDSRAKYHERKHLYALLCLL